MKDIVQHSLVWQDNRIQADVSHAVITRAQDDPHALVWLDVEGDPHAYGPTLAKTFGLSPITIEIIDEEHERAKLVQGHNYFQLVVHGITFDENTDEAIMPKLDIVFGQNYLLTVHRAPLPWLTTLRESMRSGKLEEHIMSRGAAMLLYTVLDTMVDSYFPVLDTLDEVVDQLEYAAVQKNSNEVQARIFRVKRALSQMRRVISPQVEVANALITRTGDLIPQEAEPYFADVHDHLVRSFEVIDSYRDLMSGLLDVYLTTVSNRVNEIMRQLTIISTIFLPITFITGVFGQNFGHAPQVEHDGGWNFWVALVLMGVITIMQIWYFKRRGWM
ncbi:MAG: magnesium/cobalt transporter CorA [Ktedonobacterales bacterium]